ncbi:MAG: OmpA family protein [Cyclobacteriaceae bacterium]
MKVKIAYLTLVFISVTLFTSAQDTNQRAELPKKYDRIIGKANGLYSGFIYLKAIECYKAALEVSDLDKDYPILKIADSYRLINNNEEALIWYEKIEGSSVMTKQDQANYAQVLILYGDYDKAKEIANGIGASLDRLNRVDQVSEIKIDTAAYFMENLVVNSDRADFSPAYYKDGIVFVSSREIEKLLPQNKYYWDESYYLDLYYTQNADSTEDYFSSFSKRINTIYHEGPAVFFGDDKRMIFTRNNFNQGRRKLSDDGINHLKLYYSEQTGESEKWSRPVDLPFNSDSYSVGHPTITSDAKRLYFASDMPGTMGKSDIFYSDFIGDTLWTEPTNMGLKINTQAEEMFPFIYQDTLLYFASKGHLGLGGLDLYRINLNDKSAVPENMGQPLNSEYDDFGLVMEGNSGYFSSNRPGGKGNDDIYRFVYTEIIPSYIVKLRAIDAETKKFIPDATLTVTDSLTSEIIETQKLADSTAYYQTLENVSYAASAHHHDYFSGHLRYAVGENLDADTLYYEIPLEKIEIGKAIELENIYYDLNKADIRPDAAIELNKLVDLLVDNPGIKIELSSHTDSRGSDRYNQKLSQRRAESAVAYIITQGIDSGRITAKGYGESKLVNQCSNGVKCSKEEHQRNRRTEFAVTENLSDVEVIESH